MRAESGIEKCLEVTCTRERHERGGGLQEDDELGLGAVASEVPVGHQGDNCLMGLGAWEGDLGLRERGIWEPAAMPVRWDGVLGVRS